VSIGTLDRSRTASLPNWRQETRDAQINQALFRTEKTANVHVRHLLAQLLIGVGGRGDEAAIARRLDLDQR
jgi:hypothetical protein